MPARQMNLRHTFTSIFSIFLLALFSQAIQAASLRIDPTASQVVYTPSSNSFCTIGPQGEVSCPPHALPETFSLAGNVDVGVTHEHLEFGFGYPTVDRDLIQLQTSGLISGALSKGFSLYSLFPTFGLLSGESFNINDDPCFLFVGPGSCSGGVFGYRSESTGTWDGTTLLWSGSASNTDSHEGFAFTLRAMTVPEPGTVFLMLLTLAMMALTRRGKLKPVAANSSRNQCDHSFA